jgi:molecular chaperone GrpE
MHDDKHQKDESGMTDHECYCGGACGCCEEDGQHGEHHHDHSDHKHAGHDHAHGGHEDCHCEGGECQDRITALEEAVKRSQADYNNMMRRHQEQSQRASKMAAFDFAEALVQPLSHLELAAQQLNDKGLNMVISQLWQQLQSQGLQQVGKVGDDFNPHLMEAISREGEGDTVIKVSQPGYTLYGEVIQPAKVVVGSMKSSKK